MKNSPPVSPRRTMVQTPLPASRSSSAPCHYALTAGNKICEVDAQRVDQRQGPRTGDFFDGARTGRRAAHRTYAAQRNGHRPDRHPAWLGFARRQPTKQRKRERSPANRAAQPLGLRNEAEIDNTIQKGISDGPQTSCSRTRLPQTSQSAELKR